MKSRFAAGLVAVALAVTLAGCAGTTGSDGDGRGGPTNVKPSVAGSPAAPTATATLNNMTTPSPAVTYGQDIDSASRHDDGKAAMTVKYPAAGATLGVLVLGGSDTKMSFTAVTAGRTLLAKTVAARRTQYAFFLPKDAALTGKDVKVSFTLSGSKTTFGGVVAFEGSNGR